MGGGEGCCWGFLFACFLVCFTMTGGLTKLAGHHISLFTVKGEDYFLYSGFYTEENAWEGQKP